MLEILGYLGQGFINLLDVTAILLVMLGVAIGIVGGAIPGISPSMAVALLLPVTYSLTPVQGIILLMGIYTGANYGGAITAIAINTPGTPSSAVTSFDGYPLCQQGRKIRRDSIACSKNSFHFQHGRSLSQFQIFTAAQLSVRSESGNI